MGFCPFMSKDGSQVACTGVLATCQLWVVEIPILKGHCGLLHDATVAKIQELREDVDSRLDTIISTTHHVHKEHLHGREHDANSESDSPGPDAGGQKLADLLMQEFMNGQDLDKNGLIYGVDFQSSEPMPFFMKKVRDMDGFDKGARVVSWSDILAGNTAPPIIPLP